MTTTSTTGITVIGTVKGRTVADVRLHTVADVSTHSDRELAEAARFDSSYFGFHVIRAEDDRHHATVVLYTD